MSCLVMRHRLARKDEINGSAPLLDPSPHPGELLEDRLNGRASLHLGLPASFSKSLVIRRGGLRPSRSLVLKHNKLANS